LEKKVVSEKKVTKVILVQRVHKVKPEIWEHKAQQVL